MSVIKLPQLTGPGFAAFIIGIFGLIEVFGGIKFNLVSETGLIDLVPFSDNLTPHCLTSVVSVFLETSLVFARVIESLDLVDNLLIVGEDCELKIDFVSFSSIFKKKNNGNTNSYYLCIYKMIFSLTNIESRIKMNYFKKVFAYNTVITINNHQFYINLNYLHHELSEKLILLAGIPQKIKSNYLKSSFLTLVSCATQKIAYNSIVQDLYTKVFEIVTLFQAKKLQKDFYL